MEKRFVDGQINHYYGEIGLENISVLVSPSRSLALRTSLKFHHHFAFTETNLTVFY